MRRRHNFLPKLQHSLDVLASSQAWDMSQARLLPAPLPEEPLAGTIAISLPLTAGEEK